MWLNTWCDSWELRTCMHYKQYNYVMLCAWGTTQKLCSDIFSYHIFSTKKGSPTGEGCVHTFYSNLVTYWIHCSVGLIIILIICPQGVVCVCVYTIPSRSCPWHSFDLTYRLQACVVVAWLSTNKHLRVSQWIVSICIYHNHFQVT